LMIQDAAQALVGALREEGRVIHGGLGPLIVMNVEVLGPKDAPVEILVVNLVLAEELRGRARREERKQGERQGERDDRAEPTPRWRSGGSLELSPQCTVPFS